MSPRVTASCDTGKVILTVLDCPGSRSTLVNPTSLLGGAITPLSGWWTYSGTMSVPARFPVLVTVRLAVTVPVAGTLFVTVRPLVAKVGEERPKPNGNSGP